MDENFWMAVSFVIFLYFAYRPIKRAIISALDARINDIKENLAQTEKLKAEAKSLLDEVHKEMEKFDEYKKNMIQKAKDSTEKLIEARSMEMDLALQNKRNSAVMLIESEKAKAFGKLKNEFTDNVIKLVRNYLIESKNNSVSDEEIINKFIGKN